MLGACNCTFVDIGLNNGATLTKWFHESPLMRKLPAKQSRALHACARNVSSACLYGIEANVRKHAQSACSCTRCTALPRAARARRRRAASVRVLSNSRRLAHARSQSGREC